MLLIVLLLTLTEYSKNVALAAKILAITAMPSPSHHIWYGSLMLALEARGHHVTVVSPDPEKHPGPNYRDIVLEGMYEEMLKSYDFEAMSKDSYIKNTITCFDWGADSCRAALASKGAKDLLKLTRNETFDLIIMESVFDECFFGFISEFGYPPIVAIAAYRSPPWAGFNMANPDNPSYVNTFNLPFSDRMNFFQRSANALFYLFTLLYRKVYHIPNQQKIAQDFFEKPLPPLTEIENNISLTLVNIHHSMDYPRPSVPAFIQVGGMHIKSSKPLPKDIQKYLDEAEEGAIFFSLGSNVRSDKLSTHVQQIILNVFSELPQKILWKFESSNLPRQLKNVKIDKWLPQNDILGHPNVKLFITHAGLLSVQEAIYHGVPVVGIPFLADQFTNIAKCIDHGAGEMVDITTITKETFLSSIRNVLQTPSYGKNMKKLSELFRDRPETPLETAVYWTEYVIRHKGALHLRSAALNLEWYQYLLLDVIAVIIAGMTIAILILYKMFSKVYNLVKKMNKRNKSKKQ